MDSMNLAFVACLSALSASTSSRSFASHSTFQFAAATPAPAQKTCSQGSARCVGKKEARDDDVGGGARGQRGGAARETIIRTDRPRREAGLLVSRARA